MEHHREIAFLKIAWQGDLHSVISKQWLISAIIDDSEENSSSIFFVLIL
jgi:hypothetical protein